MRLEELFICGRDTNVLLAIWSGKSIYLKLTENQLCYTTVFIW